MSVRTVIAVDGLAASGKTALAKAIARELGFAHLNSGLLYRAAALLAYEAGVDLNLEPAVAAIISSHRLELKIEQGGEADLVVDGAVRTESLSSQRVSEGASLVARHPLVRSLLMEPQRNAFPGVGLVAEGRDMGTVVFPEAAAKFFVEARLDVRAKRRCAQLEQRGLVCNPVAVTEELRQRDERDSSREVAPMKVAAGAIVIDNSDQPLEVVVQSMLAKLRECS